MIDDTISVFISIGKSNLTAMGIVIFSFIIEKITGLRLFIDHYYKWVKSPRNAEIVTNRDMGYYFILMVAVFIYDIYNGNVAFNFFTCIIALILITTLSSIFKKIHGKYQKVDPKKKDDDFY